MSVYRKASRLVRHFLAFRWPRPIGAGHGSLQNPLSWMSSSFASCASAAALQSSCEVQLAIPPPLRDGSRPTMSHRRRAIRGPILDEHAI